MMNILGIAHLPDSGLDAPSCENRGPTWGCTVYRPEELKVEHPNAAPGPRLKAPKAWKILCGKGPDRVCRLTGTDYRTLLTYVTSNNPNGTWP